MVKYDNKGKRVAAPEPESHIHVGAATRKSYVIAKGGKSRYNTQDPSICMRVVRDGQGGVEFIIAGDQEETFAQACITNWHFESVHLKSTWGIEDECGNDVTDRSLGSVEGIFTLVPK